MEKRFHKRKLCVLVFFFFFFFVFGIFKESQKKKKLRDQKIIAPAGNRTRASRVTGENSTTEPPVLVILIHIVTYLSVILYDFPATKTPPVRLYDQAVLDPLLVLVPFSFPLLLSLGSSLPGREVWGTKKKKKKKSIKKKMARVGFEPTNPKDQKTPEKEGLTLSLARLTGLRYRAVVAIEIFFFFIFLIPKLFLSFFLKNCV